MSIIFAEKKIYRHKGYIPWDDDIDICMLREDFDRFVRLFSQAETDNYVIGDISLSSEWITPFAKVYDSRTTLIHKNVSTPYMGVFIDIFPIDGASKDDVIFQKDKMERRHYNRIVNGKIGKLSIKQGLKNNLILICLKSLYCFVSFKKVKYEWNKSSQKRNDEGGKFVSDAVCGLMKKPLPRDLFENVIDYKFEDRSFLCVSDADTVLKVIYGDYMKLPPESERVPSHDYIAFWNNK